MAAHVGIPGGRYRLREYEQDSGNPGTVAGSVVLLCSAYNMSFSGEKATTDRVSPDCSDFTLPAWIERTVTSQSGTITADGDIETGDLERLMGYWENNTRIPLLMTGHAVGNSQGNGVNKHQTIMGFFYCTNVTVTGSRETASTISLTLVSDGKVALLHEDTAGLAETFFTEFAY